VWLSGRLRILLEFAATGGKLRRIFVWGSFVTGKPAPGDIDILLIMDEDFETEIDSASAQAVFDSVRARLLFESDVFWARASIGDKVRAGKKCWVFGWHLASPGSFRKPGIFEVVLPWFKPTIKCCSHSNASPICGEFSSKREKSMVAGPIRMAEPILLEIEQREQEILEYLSSEIEQPVAIQVLDRENCSPCWLPRIDGP